MPNELIDDEILTGRNKAYRKYAQEIKEIDAQLFLLDKIKDFKGSDLYETDKLDVYIISKCLTLKGLKAKATGNLNCVRVELAEKHLKDAGCLPAPVSSMKYERKE